MWMIPHLNYVQLKFTPRLSNIEFWIMNRTDPQENDRAELCFVILACAQPAQLHKRPRVPDTIFPTRTIPVASTLISLTPLLPPYSLSFTRQPERNFKIKNQTFQCLPFMFRTKSSDLTVASKVLHDLDPAYSPRLRSRNSSPSLLPSWIYIPTRHALSFALTSHFLIPLPRIFLPRIITFVTCSCHSIPHKYHLPRHTGSNPVLKTSLLTLASYPALFFSLPLQLNMALNSLSLAPGVVSVT